MRVSVPYRGSLYSNIGEKIMLKDKLKEVSVPYRGSLYSNIIESCFVHFTTFVSVPYRGSLYSNQKMPYIENIEIGFPSPIGVLYILKRLNVVLTNELNIVSVPYRGSLYSKL